MFQMRKKIFLFVLASFFHGVQIFFPSFCVCSCGRIYAQDLKHNPWSLVIYRSENDSSLNNVRCWLKIEDEDGNDAFGEKVKAYYEWVALPGRLNSYRKSVYLSGGMAAHLNLKKGKYRISVYTPEDELMYFSGEAKRGWKSNVFLYDTENPAKVIFVYPSADGNGFYNGNWIVSGKAPEWFRFTKPKNVRR